jgi:hypothetical protein
MLSAAFVTIKLVKDNAIEYNVTISYNILVYLICFDMKKSLVEGEVVKNKST